MSNRITLTEEIIEGTNRPISFTIVDPDDVALQPATLLLTFYDDRSGALLGGRTAQQDALNANGVTVTSGAVSWQPTIADNAMVDAARRRELHIALWEWTWVDGAVTRQERQEIAFRVVNLREES